MYGKEINMLAKLPKDDIGDEIKGWKDSSLSNVDVGTNGNKCSDIYWYLGKFFHNRRDYRIHHITKVFGDLGRRRQIQYVW